MVTILERGEPGPLANDLDFDAADFGEPQFIEPPLMGVPHFIAAVLGDGQDLFLGWGLQVEETAPVLPCAHQVRSGED